MNNKGRIQIDLTSKLVLVGLTLLLFFLANARFQQWRKQVAIEKEKKKLQDDIASLSKKNQELSDSLSYLGSSDFKDRMARQQLNLKRDGEVVFGFVDTPQDVGTSIAKTPNYQKWVEYFFGTDQVN